MKHIAIFDHRTNKRVAFLDKARDIGYTLEHNSLWSARFTLPLSDPKNKHCQYFNYAEVYDGDKYIGLFRIVPAKLTKNDTTAEIAYECEHVLATLMDDILFGWHEIGNLGVFTSTVLRYILDRQGVKRWQLEECDFRHQFLYGWEHENLLKALFSVPAPFQDDYKWEFNTQSTPWTISLKHAPVEVRAEIRYRKNMAGIMKTEDPTSICTRLYPLGFGEGDNQLNIASVNNGKMHIDADTQDRYGIINKIWVDQRYQHADSLYDAAMAMLDELKVPTVTYTVDTLHSNELQQRDVGDYVRVVDDEIGVDLYTRIVSIDKPDIVGAPANAAVTIANKSKNIASSIADLNDRQRISETYSQGAVTLFTNQFYDNCAPDQPAEFRFYIPSNVVHLNQIMLAGRAAAFRGYTRATQGGGARASTTGGGGGTNSTTSSGGSSTPTSSSGGGSMETSSSVALFSSNAELDSSDPGGVGGANHNHGIPSGTYVAVTDGTTNVTGSRWYVASGKHTHPAHSHTINLHPHTHSVSIPNHSHGFSTPSHEHSFSVPDHTHNIEHGIYRGTTASSLTIAVDGKNAGSFGASISDLNVIDFLSKDGGGNVTRGWHTITVTPNILTRVEFDLVIQLFANSRGGGQF
ncbi:MAG: phage tail protein [Firmicutes bacterium]|nr:phage tail protein [Bacillota bacterium]